MVGLPFASRLSGLLAYWQAYARAVNGFTTWGLGGLAAATSQHGGTPNPSVFLTAIAVAYIIIRGLPIVMALFAASRIVHSNLIVRGGLALGLWAAWTTLPHYLFQMGTSPLQVIQTASVGPSQLSHALTYQVHHTPLHLVAVLGKFAIFLGISYVGFYTLNLLMYFVGHYLARPNPAFTRTDPGHVAKLWTTIWVIMLVFEPGANALISTLLIIGSIMAQRSMRDGILHAFVKQPLGKVREAASRGRGGQQEAVEARRQAPRQSRRQATEVREGEGRVRWHSKD